MQWIERTFDSSMKVFNTNEFTHGFDDSVGNDAVTRGFGSHEYAGVTVSCVKIVEHCPILVPEKDQK